MHDWQLSSFPPVQVKHPVGQVRQTKFILSLNVPIGHFFTHIPPERYVLLGAHEKQFFPVKSIAVPYGQFR